MASPSKGIIIPTLREHHNLKRLIPVIFQHVPDARILISDDHSQDGTNELAGERVTVLDRVADHGYGKSVLEGFRFAMLQGFDYIVTMDADFSHNPQSIPDMLRGLGEADVVIGSRYVAGGGIANWNLRRRLLSRFANWYVRRLLGVQFRDGTTGFVAYRRSAIQALVDAAPRSEGYSFLVECKYILEQAGFRISEVPIIFQDRVEGTSKMSWRVIWESIWLPWRLRFFPKKANISKA